MRYHHYGRFTSENGYGLCSRKCGRAFPAGQFSQKLTHEARCNGKPVGRGIVLMRTKEESDVSALPLA